MTPRRPRDATKGFRANIRGDAVRILQHESSTDDRDEDDAEKRDEEDDEDADGDHVQSEGDSGEYLSKNFGKYTSQHVQPEINGISSSGNIFHHLPEV